MKKSFLISLVLLAAMGFAGGNAWAKTVIGSVARVDAASSLIEVSKNGGAKIVKVWVNGKTKFKGVAGLADLKDGFPISIDADKDKASQNWIAKSVELGKIAKK